MTVFDKIVGSEVPTKTQEELPYFKFPEPVNVNGVQTSTAFFILQRPMSEKDVIAHHKFWGLSANDGRQAVTMPCLEKLGQPCPGCIASEEEKRLANSSKNMGSVAKPQVYVPVIQFEKLEKGKPAGWIKPVMFVMPMAVLKSLDSMAALGVFPNDMVGDMFMVARTGEKLSTRYADAVRIAPSGLDLTQYPMVTLQQVLPILEKYSDDETKLIAHYSDNLRPQFTSVLVGFPTLK